MHKGALETARMLLATVVAGIALAACGSTGSTGSAGSQPASVASTVAPAGGRPAPTILAARIQPTTFAQVQGAVLALYRAHRSISSFTVRDVEYSPATRDKVLRVCHTAGPEKSPEARESVRVLACAPLIFFFYSYGRQAAVPQAVGVARNLYWYAVTHNRTPDAIGPGLTRLLRSWGIA